MAYDPTRMALLGSTSAGKLWSYRNAIDSAAIIRAAGYFLPIWLQLNVGDTIHCHSGDGSFFSLRVTASTSSSLTTVGNTAYA